MMLEWRQVVMWIIGGVLIYLAIKKRHGACAAFAHGLRGDTS